MSANTKKAISEDHINEEQINIGCREDRIMSFEAIIIILHKNFNRGLEKILRTQIPRVDKLFQYVFISYTSNRMETNKSLMQAIR